MKSYFILISIFALIASPVLAAEDFFFKPYIGAEYDYIHANYPNGGNQIAENNLNGGDVHIGARFHKYFGAEAGYIDTASASKSNVLGTGIDTSVRINGGSLDAMGYLPLDAAGKIEIIGTAGVSVLRAKLELKGAGGHANLAKTETNGRIGGGGQYWLSDNLNIRGIIRYQGADFSGNVNNAVIASLGANWQF